jgi:hypothetical protein
MKRPDFDERPREEEPISFHEQITQISKVKGEVVDE